MKQEPTEATGRNRRSRNPRPSGRGGCQSCEHDSGADYELELIEPDQEHRYRFSVDSYLDISCLDQADSMAG